MPENKPEEMDKEELVQAKVKELAEIFPNVQIFVSWGDYPNEKYQYGHGNWYARYGQLKFWVAHLDSFHV